METVLLTSIIFLNIILLAVIGFLGFLVFKLLSHKKSLESNPNTNIDKNYHPEIKKRLEEVQFTVPFSEDVFCSFHPSEAAEVQCGMCTRYFCHKCVRPMKSIYFCKEHMALYLRGNWNEVLTIKTSSDDPEQGVRLYDIKAQIYKEQHIPTFIETHYKIEVDGDEIETYLVLFAEASQSEKVIKALKVEEFIHTTLS